MPVAKPDAAEEPTVDPTPEPEAKAEVKPEEPKTEGHPEPVPTGHVLTQDNVSEPGVQKTHSALGSFEHRDERLKG